jgi:hypothetical protein
MIRPMAVGWTGRPFPSRRPIALRLSPSAYSAMTSSVEMSCFRGRPQWMPAAFARRMAVTARVQLQRSAPADLQ